MPTTRYTHGKKEKYMKKVSIKESKNGVWKRYTQKDSMTVRKLRKKKLKNQIYQKNCKRKSAVDCNSEASTGFKFGHVISRARPQSNSTVFSHSGKGTVLEVSICVIWEKIKGTVE